MEQEIIRNPDLRQRIISIGIGILLADGERLLRGPLLKSHDAQNGWIDLTVENLRCWQQRLRAIQVEVQSEKGRDSSSRSDRMLTPSRDWRSETDIIDVGEAVAWILVNEEQGQRLKG